MKKILIPFAFGILLNSCGSSEHQEIAEINTGTTAVQMDTAKPPVVDTILANTTPQAKAIREQAEAMNNCLLKKDFKAYATYIHPGLVKKLGGEQTLLKALEDGFKKMDEKGSAITKIIVDEPGSIVVCGRDLQSVLTETMEMKAEGGIMITKSIIIAISKDNGERWYFIDTGNRDLATMQKELPGLSSALILPKPEGPKFVETIKDH